MRGMAMLLTLGSLLTLAGCGSGPEECRKAYPSGSAAYESCRRAVLQRENAQLNRMEGLEFRARD
jgi:hypothetical protein